MFETYHDLFVFLITVLVGLAGMGLTQWLKNILKLQDIWALVLTGGVSLVLAVAELFLSGAIGIADFTIANLPAVLGGIFSLATVFYKLLIAESTKIV